MLTGSSQKPTRRALLQALLATALMPGTASALDISLRPPKGRGPVPPPGAEAVVEKARLKGVVAFAVADAQSGDLLEARLPDIPVAPASVAKSITALYALDTLGSAHRFATRVVAVGEIKDGVLHGDLVLAGGADPILDTRGLAELAAQLKASGLREVTGDFLVYDRAVATVRTIDPDQPDHVGYSPAVAGIALNFNRVHFEWRRNNGKYSLSMDARAGKYRPEVTIARMSLADRKGPVYTFSDTGGRDEWTVAKGALGGGGARWLPVRRPGLYAAEVFATLARAHGIVLKPAKPSSTAPTGTDLARIESAPLGEILQAMLKYSNNLIAEMVGLASTQARGRAAATLAESAAEMNTWAQASLGMSAPAFVDHSGLGSGSRVTAEDMVRGLLTPGHAERLRPLLKPVKLLDAKGRTVNSHPVKAEAKTGTLNFVSALAGYIRTPADRDLVFAVFCADEETRDTLSRSQRERPPGGRSYATRARRLQKRLIMRWGDLFAQAEAPVSHEG